MSPLDPTAPSWQPLPASTALLLIQVGTTLTLVGLIWTIQLVHYPLFDHVAPERFADFHRQHSSRISLLVVPLMLAEAATAALLLVTRPAVVSAASAWIGVALLAVVWGSTALLQVPQHGVLASGFDAEAHRLLVAGNWVRTAAWSARGALVVWWTGRLAA